MIRIALILCAMSLQKMAKIMLEYLKRTLFRGNDCDITVGHHLDRCKEWMLFQGT